MTAHRGRGGRQYDLKRVSTTKLSPGLRSVLSDYEAAVRVHEFKGAQPPEEWEGIDRYYDRRKQALIRKLLRIQNGEEYTDVEELKKQMRRMARLLNAINQAPEQAREILTAAPESLKDVERIIAQRRSW